ncbi:hypothetical protein JTB14_035749 [Gonioctena quinquepunctata]|nr:hypothetical protein JTB14_035749 [Gonioctena quinquepunctata]
MVKNRNQHLTSRIEKLEAMLHQGLNDIKSQVSPKGDDQGNLVDSINVFENKFPNSIDDIKLELDNINKKMPNQQKNIETSKQDQRLKFLVINGMKKRQDKKPRPLAVTFVKKRIKHKVFKKNLK